MNGQVLGYTRVLAKLRGAEWARVRTWSGWEGFERGPSGLFVPVEMASGPPPGHPPIAVDLFAGAGGFSLGIHQAGFHIVAALEWDVHASMTYLVNLGSPTTRIYVPDPELKKRLMQAFAREAKHPQTPMGWKGPNGQADHEPSPWARAAPVDHGEYLTWPGAGTGWIAGALQSRSRDALGDLRTRDLISSGVEPDEQPRAVEDVPEDICLEPCQTFFLADAREVTGQYLLDGIATATGWRMRRGDVDLVVGGPPCQGFSIAGKRSVYDPRNSLVFEFARLCVEMLPKSLCMENVPEMLHMITAEGELVIDRLTRILEEGGMGHDEQLRRMLETTAGVGVAMRSVRRHGEPRPAGESRGERKRRLREERKDAKREARRTVSVAVDGTVLLQEELFANELAPLDERAGGSDPVSQRGRSGQDQRLPQVPTAPSQAPALDPATTSKAPSTPSRT